MRRSAETLGADYLVLCPDQLRDDPGEAAPFATRLSRNEVTVPWLERVALPETPLRVWRVRSASVTGRSAASPVP